MKDLIEALTILLKYMDEDSFHSKFPTHCGHDVLSAFTDQPVSEEDVARLDELGFHPGTEWGDDEDSRTSFSSYTFGSC